MELGKLTKAQIDAARLVAGKKHTVDEIAKLVGVSPRTIDYWKTDETFKAEVDAIRSEWRKTVKVKGIADPEYRIKVYNDLFNRSLAVIRERSEDPEMQAIPGGKTGLLVRTIKMRAVGQGESVAEYEYAVDTGLMAEIRALGKHVAVELGQDKPEGTPGEVSVAVTIVQNLEEGRRRAAEAAIRIRESQSSQPAR